MKKILLALLLSAAAPGSGAQTMQLAAEVSPGPTTGDVRALSVFSNKLYFQGKDSIYGQELRSYSGSGTPALVADISPGLGWGLQVDYGFKMPVLGNRMYFPANDGVNGTELWSYDGASAPVRLTDLSNDPSGSNPQHLAVIGGKLYFDFTNDTMGTELGIYDGVNPPVLLSLVPGIQGSFPHDFTYFNGKIYFAASNASYDNELYALNPANNAVSLVANINPFNPSYPFNFTVLGNSLYFTAIEAGYGRELFRYDGTSVQRLTDLNPGNGDGLNPTLLQVYNGQLYFQGNVSSTARQLYRYDPATGVTMLLQDFYPGLSAYIGEMAVYNGNLYLTASSFAEGNELWVYNGAIFNLAADLVPGTGSSSPSDLQVFNGALYLSAATPGTGRELFRYTDGLGLTSLGFSGTVALSPNPSSGDAFLSLSCNTAGSYSVAVSDASGRPVWQADPQTYAAGMHQIRLPLHSFASGTYFCQLRESGQVVFSGKLVRN